MISPLDTRGPEPSAQQSAVRGMLSNWTPTWLTPFITHYTMFVSHSDFTTDVDHDPIAYYVPIVLGIGLYDTGGRYLSSTYAIIFFYWVETTH